MDIFLFDFVLILLNILCFNSTKYLEDKINLWTLKSRYFKLYKGSIYTKQHFFLITSHVYLTLKVYNEVSTGKRLFPY